MIAQANERWAQFRFNQQYQGFNNRFSITCNCPSNWLNIGSELATEYPESSWVYENLGLDNHMEYISNKVKNRLWDLISHSLFFVLFVVFVAHYLACICLYVILCRDNSIFWLFAYMGKLLRCLVCYFWWMQRVSLI